MRKIVIGAGILVALLVIIPVVAWFGYQWYVQLVVARSPGTISVIKSEQGDLLLGAYQGRGGEQSISTDQQKVASGTPVEADNRPVLPPTQLHITKIGVDARVVLADNDNLPKFKGIGWYLGSGYPGFHGNVVLFGHLNGKYETFARLNELVPGDGVDVVAVDTTYRYTVATTQVVAKDDVAVMAPTRDARLTLITCAGTFIPDTRDYTERLIVIATLNE